jgi:hypothetical protein
MLALSLVLCLIGCTPAQLAKVSDASNKRDTITNTTNREGLSYNEWIAAANVKKSTSMRKAWMRGMDPTEYRARGQQRTITAKGIIG